MACPDENELVALFEQRLGDAQRDALEEHVDGCARCRQLVATVARSEPADGDGEEPALVPEVAADRYELLSLIGSGGMGEVYAAFDPHLGRKIAIKVLRGDRGGGGDARHGAHRIVREARALARVTHPNVLSIYDVGVMNGQVFLAMELVSGVTLREWVRKERPGWRRTLDVLVAAGRGLAAAHAAGLVHRDFKPDNVLVGEGDRVLVADFGLTRFDAEVEARGAGSPIVAHDEGETLTRDGALLGTRGYIAPEILDGGGADVRSDVYSYCVATYEMLFGERPPSQDDVSSSSGRTVSAEGVAVPRWVRRVVQRGLRARPEERYASMGALLADLEGAKRARRRRTAVALWGLAAIAVAAAGGAAASRPSGVKERSAPRASASAPVTMTDFAAETKGAPAAVAVYRAGMESLRGASNLLGIQQIERSLTLDPSLAAAHVRLIYFASASPELEEGRAHYKAALDLRAELSPRDRALLDALEPLTRDPPDTAERVRRLERAARDFPGDAEIAWYFGQALVDFGDRDGALAGFDRALALDPGYALAYWGKASVERFATGDLAALEQLGHCVEVSPIAASCLRVRGVVLAQRGQCDAFLADARRVVEVEPGEYAAQAMLARALAPAPGAYPAVEQALRQKWTLTAESHRAAVVARDEIDLAIWRGDFADAERAADSLARELAGAPAERPHAELVSRLLDVYAETGDAPRATRVAKEFLHRRKAWSSGLGDDPEDLVKSPVPRAIALLARVGELDEQSARVAREEWVREWQSRLSARDRRYLWFAAHALPAETRADAESALRAQAVFDLPGAVLGSAVVDIAKGMVLGLAGDPVAAAPLLARGTAACIVLEEPALQTRAWFALGQSREAMKDAPGACAAYGTVLARWGAARPRSATADTARARAQALTCPR